MRIRYNNNFQIRSENNHTINHTAKGLKAFVFSIIYEINHKCEVRNHEYNSTLKSCNTKLLPNQFWIKI